MDCNGWMAMDYALPLAIKNDGWNELKEEEKNEKGNCHTTNTDPLPPSTAVMMSDRPLLSYTYSVGVGSKCFYRTVVVSQVCAVQYYSRVVL
jgi:hypothetical protein